MSRSVVAIRRFTAILIALLTFVGCGSGPGSSGNPTSSSAPSPSPGTPGVTSSPPPTGIAITPTNATLQIGAVQQFTAIGAPFGARPVVSWSISGTGCTGASCGTIDSTGKYTAPPTVPDPPTVTIMAVLATDSSKSVSATVILGSNPSNAVLKGQYAFLLQGYDGDGNMAIAGSFTADGNGNLTSGIADFNFSGDIFVSTNVPFTGTYSVGPDNRGSMTIAGKGIASGQSFSIALGSFASGVAGRGRIAEVDATDMWGSGLLAKQDQSAFSTAAVTGGYAFGFAGTNIEGYTLVADGRFTADSGMLSAGQIDVSNLNTLLMPAPALDLPFAGTYSVDTNGRGTASFTFSGQDPEFSKFSFYVISASELLFIEVDNCSGGGGCSFKGGISGVALQQAGGPFSVSSLNDAAVFYLSGGSASVSNVTVGREIFDGSGNLSGTSDSNNGVGVFTSNSAFSGTYFTDTNGLGRGEITLVGDPQPKPFYLVSPGRGFIIDTGSSGAAGMFERQIEGPFSNASISGDYVFGTLPPPLNFTIDPISGAVVANGAGGLSETSDGKGISDRNFTGTYSMAPTGTATVVITPIVGSPSNLVFYFISPSKAVAIHTDSGATDSVVYIIEQ